MNSCISQDCTVNYCSTGILLSLLLMSPQVLKMREYIQISMKMRYFRLSEERSYLILFFPFQPPAFPGQVLYCLPLANLISTDSPSRYYLQSRCSSVPHLGLFSPAADLLMFLSCSLECSYGIPFYPASVGRARVLLSSTSRGTATGKASLVSLTRLLLHCRLS